MSAKWLPAYRQLLVQHADLLVTLENALRTLSYLIPGKPMVLIQRPLHGQ